MGVIYCRSLCKERDTVHSYIQTYKQLLTVHSYIQTYKQLLTGMICTVICFTIKLKKHVM